MVIAYGALSARENGPVGLRYYAVMKAYRSADIDLSRSGSHAVRDDPDPVGRGAAGI